MVKPKKKEETDSDSDCSSIIETFSIECLKCKEVKLISEFIFTKKGQLECMECALQEIKITMSKKGKK